MADLSACDVIVFDLDDTLYLERDYVRSGFQVLDELLSTEGIMNGFCEDAWRLFEQGIRGRILNAVFTDRNIPLSQDLLSRLVWLYRCHEPQISLLADARRLINKLRGHKKLALISDGPLLSQESKIDALGLRSCLDFVILTDSWGRAFWKPHIRAFEAIEHVFPFVPRTRLAYVADNPLKDFIAPRFKGWRTIRVCRSGGEHSTMNALPDHDADASIGSFDELFIKGLG